MSMLIQVGCGVIQGVGPYLTPGTGMATIQVLSVAGIKIGWAMILLAYRPCACGLTNAVIVCQFTSEGISSILLFIAAKLDEDGSNDTVATMRLVSFLLLLTPVFMPVMQKFYVRCWTNLRHTDQTRAQRQCTLNPSRTPSR